MEHGLVLTTLYTARYFSPVSPNLNVLGYLPNTTGWIWAFMRWLIRLESRKSAWLYLLFKWNHMISCLNCQYLIKKITKWVNASLCKTSVKVLSHSGNHWKCPRPNLYFFKHSGYLRHIYDCNITFPKCTVCAHNRVS